VMFVCKACLRKGLSAVASESRVLLHPLRTPTATALTPNRRASSSAIPATRNLAIETFGPPPDEKEDLAEARRNEKLEWVVNKHLQYLKDPLKISEHVQRTLEKDKYEEALMLVRKASRDTKVTVSWNHLIDYKLKSQHLHAAIKLYNEMKKRAQLPDSRTFTIIFRGCAQSNHPKLAVSEAVRIYNSMLLNGRVAPNTIHLNAVLDVCAQAGDLDNLFTVLQSMNNGTRRPDGRTYTIVLNALRHKPDNINRLEVDEAATKEAALVSINRAKMVWEDVMTRWNNGQILIDESLVCAMGRVLAMGDHNDKKSILDLLESTMKVPRFDQTEGASIAGDAQAGLKSNEGKTSIAIPQPGNNVLSLLMQCLAITKKTSLAPRYWQHFTTVYGLKPDKANFVSYLKVLMKGRASTKTADAVCSMPVEFLAPLIYRLAFSTCIHDELNKHAFANACRIFDFMVEHSKYPDPLSMRLFLQSARGNVRHHYEKYKDDATAGRLAVGKQICTAIERMWQPFRILMNSFSYSESPIPRRKELWGLSEGERLEAVSTARRMIAAMDVVMNEKLAEDEDVLKTLKSRRIVLNKLVERYIDTLDTPDETKGKRSPKKDGKTDLIFPSIA